jgi:hypothetical protein
MPETAAKPSKRATAAQKPKAKGKVAKQVAIAPKRTGRPSKQTLELTQEICHRISTGEPLLQICKDERMPERRTFYDWLERDDSLSARFARAREEGCDAMAEESLAITDNEPLAVFDDAGNKRYDPGSIAWNKNRAEHRLKLLACWNPKKYGTKVALGGDPGNPIQVEAQVEADGFLAAIMKNAELKRQVSANE